MNQALGMERFSRLSTDKMMLFNPILFVCNINIIKEAKTMEKTEGKALTVEGLQHALSSAKHVKQDYEKLAEETPSQATRQIFQDMASDMQRHIDQLDYRMQSIGQSGYADRSH